MDTHPSNLANDKNNPPGFSEPNGSNDADSSPESSSSFGGALTVVSERTILRSVPISDAAARHLLAWDTDQKVRALHEAGHVIVGSALRIPIKTADIRGHHNGYTEIGDHDDDQPQAQTASRMLDKIVMFLGGLAAEKLLIGEGTDGSISDLHSATRIAMERIEAGLDPRAPFVNPDGLGMGRQPPVEMWDAICAAVATTLSEARDRADAMAADHRDHIINFAQRLHDTRRLTDNALRDAIAETAAG